MSVEETKTDTERWIELAKIAQQDFFNRRQLEWRLSFSFWTAIAAFTATFFVEYGVEKPECLCWIVSVYAAGFLLFAFWTYLVQRAHWRGKRFWLYYMNMAAGWTTKAGDLIDESGAVKGDTTWQMNKPWFVAHVLFTLLLLVLSLIAIARLKPRQPAGGASDTKRDSAGVVTRAKADYRAGTCIPQGCVG